MASICCDRKDHLLQSQIGWLQAGFCGMCLGVAGCVRNADFQLLQPAQLGQLSQNLMSVLFHAAS